VIFTEQAMQILDIRENETVWQSHFDEVVEMPEGSELLATNEHTEIQAYINHELKIIGTQFHPEFDKKAGDRLFLGDREFLAKHDFNADEIITRGPSLDTGKVFFGYFLEQFT
jgi:GMP synthase (glutamine-hydrolysing)